jgi:hypothetical protein
MNAPLPESIRKALESVSLDDHARSGWRRSHRCTVGCAAAHGGLGVERACVEEA